ncbi:MAG TPA: hypothetical protein VNO31_02405, partial [Umezawaea sp.]|nr:hypothetical protein [Umezawaea sp.]
RGDPLGILQPGHEGCPIPACLHWGVRRGQEYLNPIRLLYPGRVRLLPLPPATTALEPGLADNNAPRRARDPSWSRKVPDVERRAEQASGVVEPGVPSRR